MSPIMTFRIAFKALARNKMRTALTMLGMIIGVSAVITLVAMGNGAQANLEDAIRGAGTNLITVRAGDFRRGGVSRGAGAAGTLVVEDADAIREIPGVQYLAPGVAQRAQVIAGSANWNTQVQGTDVEFPMIRDWEVELGTFFSDADVRAASKVAVLGTIVRDNLFGEGADPVGQVIRVRNQPFRVIGVLEAKGQAGMNEDQDDTILVPYTTVMKKLMGTTSIRDITVSAATADDVPRVSAAVTELMRQRHNILSGMDDDFMVRTMDEMANIRGEQMETMTLLLAGVAGVSLLVGGIGIMNIMLVSVTERTREIGLRMAIGARGRDVLLQFLVEAIVVSLMGGLVGIGIGFAASEVLTRFFEMRAIVPPDAVGMAFGFAAATGIFFGFYPAQKAARLDPIDALRFE